MRVLVACEFSGTVRDAFIRGGHDAVSVDLIPSEAVGPHIQADLCSFPASWWSQWDMMVAHPPCTDLAASGARHFWRKEQAQADALDFVAFLMSREVPRWALENPVGVISTAIRPPDQIIQPWQFGCGETKATCLWLEGLDLLRPTDIVPGRSDRIHRVPGGPRQWRERSRTYQGIANAMASQWGRVAAHPTLHPKWA